MQRGGGLGNMVYPYGNADPGDSYHLPCNILRGQFQPITPPLVAMPLPAQRIHLRQMATGFMAWQAMFGIGKRTYFGSNLYRKAEKHRPTSCTATG